MKYKRPVGWQHESHRHYLAAKGVKTNRYNSPQYHKFTKPFEERIPKKSEKVEMSELKMVNGKLVLVPEVKVKSETDEEVVLEQTVRRVEMKKEAEDQLMKLRKIRAEAMLESDNDIRELKLKIVDKEMKRLEDGFFSKKSYQANKYYYTPTYVAGDLAPIAADGIGTAGASAVSLIPVAVPLLLLAGGTVLVKKRYDRRKKQGKGFFAEKDAQMVSMTPEKLKVFDRKMAQAKADGKDQFMFEGRPVLVSYGKYASEYLHGQFGK